MFIPGGRCVMKMDHHCKFSMFYLKIRNLIWLILLLSETLGPWINNCVGHYNHGHFVGFLTFAVLGCAQASFVLAMTLYYGLNRVSDKWSHFDHFKHEYQRSRAYICLSLSSPFSSSSSVTVTQLWTLSRYSCFYLGSRIQEFLIKTLCNFESIIHLILSNIS